MGYPYTSAERRLADAYRSMQVVGDPRTVRSRIEELSDGTLADEIMITTNVFDHAERLRSYERLAETSSRGCSRTIGPGATYLEEDLQEVWIMHHWVQVTHR